MADETTAPVLRKPSTSKIRYGLSRGDKANGYFGQYRKELEAASFDLVALTALRFEAAKDDPSMETMDALFAMANDVIKAGEELKLKADEAAYQAEEENLEKLGSRINKAIEWLTRNEDKMDEVVELREVLVDLSFNLAEGKVNAREGWKAFKKVDQKIQVHQTKTIVWLVGKLNRGWLLNKQGETGRHANAYRKLGLHAKVAEWMAKIPADDAPFKDHRAFRDEGWKLKDLVEKPWGGCKGEACGGKGALTPNRDGKIQPKCGKCFHASQPKREDTGRPERLNPERELAEGIAEDPRAFDGILRDGRPVLAHQAAVDVEDDDGELSDEKLTRKPKRNPRSSKREQARQNEE